jgi:hypothetical protein
MISFFTTARLCESTGILKGVSGSKAFKEFAEVGDRLKGVNLWGKRGISIEELGRFRGWFWVKA